MAESVFNKPIDTAIQEINDKIGTVPSGETVEGQIDALNSNTVKTSSFALVTAVVSAGGGTADVNYPSGFSQQNCCPVSCFVDMYGNRYGDNIVNLQLQSSKINIELTGGTSGNHGLVSILLQRIS